MMSDSMAKKAITGFLGDGFVWFGMFQYVYVCFRMPNGNKQTQTETYDGAFCMGPFETCNQVCNGMKPCDSVCTEVYRSDYGRVCGTVVRDTIRRHHEV